MDTRPEYVLNDLKFVIAGNLFAGLSLLLCGPHRTSGDAYGAARNLGSWLNVPIYPVRLFGIILLILTAALLVGIHQKSLAILHPTALALAMYWAWWATVFILGAKHQGAFLGPMWALFWAIRHLRITSWLT